MSFGFVTSIEKTRNFPGFIIKSGNFPECHIEIYSGSYAPEKCDINFPNYKSLVNKIITKISFVRNGLCIKTKNNETFTLSIQCQHQPNISTVLPFFLVSYKNPGGKKYFETIDECYDEIEYGEVDYDKEEFDDEYDQDPFIFDDVSSSRFIYFAK
jgi:hypothetical protein